MDDTWPGCGEPARANRRHVRHAVVILLARLAVLMAASGVWAAMAATVHDGGPGSDPPLHRWSWQTWSTESGLPQISGKAIAKDHDGLIWVGTENGLARFDGGRFEVFMPGTTPQLAASWITRLMVDRDGRVWIGTLRNVAVFADGRFLGSDDLGEVTALAQADDGGILVGGDRLYRATVGGDRLLVTQDPADAGAVMALLADPVGGGLWIGERSGRLRHRLDGRDRLLALPSGLSRIAALVRLGDALWLAGDTGLFRLEGDGFVPVALTPSGAGGAVQALAAADDGTLWIASHGNLYRRFGDGRVEAIGSQVAHAFPWVVALLPTADGVWMGSQYHGLRYYWLPVVQRFGGEDGLHDPSLWSFATDGDGLLVGTDDGVAAWDGFRFHELVPGRRLPHPAAYSVLRDRQGRLWVGTRAGMVVFDAGLERARLFDELRGAQVNGLVEHEDGSVWIASAAGLFRHPAAGGALEHVNVNGILSGYRIRALAWTPDGVAWIGTESGLFRYHGSYVEQIVGTGMDGAFVTSVRALDDGRVIVGSYDRGMAVGWPDGRWRHHTEASGLPSDTAFNLQVVADGVLVSFADGVYHWPLPDADAPTPPFRMLIHDIGDRPGRSRTRCCNGAGNDKGIVHQGAYWLPSLNGAVRVPLDTAVAAAPKVAILAVNDMAPGPAEVVLDTARRNLSLRFHSVDFRDGFRLRYRHRLIGVDPDWVDTRSRDSVTYPQLPPGRFRFEVQARLPYQPWGEPAAIQIRAPPRFVESWAFRSLLLLVLLAVVFALIRWRERVLRQQKQKLEHIVTVRTSELALANLRLGELNQVLVEASLTDPLTGLRNRRHLLQRMSAMQSDVRAAWRAGSTRPVLGVVVIDVDHFKRINDALGHMAGDAVLCRIARLLGRIVGDDDELARWGGEEFVVATMAASGEDLLVFAERLRLAIAAEAIEVTAAHRVTASVGVAAWPASAAALDRHDWTVSLGLADIALYRAKASGRNRSALIVFPGIGPEAWPERPDTATVRRWLDEGRAELHLRP